MKIFKCNSCNTLLEVIYPTNSELENHDCGGVMTEVKAGSVDAALEKHVPVVSLEGNELVVSVGSVLHPMTDEHYITSIWAEFEDGSLEKTGLIPSNQPEARFNLKNRTGKVTVYEYCNLHGLWKTEFNID